MMKILIVDDNPTNAVLMRSILRKRGECVLSNSGEEALEAVKHGIETGEPYNIILLDIVMPDLDGHETLRAIRELEKSAFSVSQSRAKIIMTSALDDIENIVQSFEELSDAYFVKPIPKRDLLDKIDELMSSSS